MCRHSKVLYRTFIFVLYTRLVMIKFHWLTRYLRIKIYKFCKWQNFLYYLSYEYSNLPLLLVIFYQFTICIIDTYWTSVNALSYLLYKNRLSPKFIIHVCVQLTIICLIIILYDCVTHNMIKLWNYNIRGTADNS